VASRPYYIRGQIAFYYLAGGRKAYDYFLRNGNDGRGGVDVNIGLMRGRELTYRGPRQTVYHARPIGRARVSVVSPQRQLIRRRDSSCTPDRDYNIMPKCTLYTLQAQCV